jgi:hypothetical protein
MRFSIIVLLAIAYAWGFFSDSLEVIDFDHQCLMWSNDNHGCTGHSPSLGQLNGRDCSGRYLYDREIGITLMRLQS